MLEDEERPVADRIDGVPLPSSSLKLFSHENQMQQMTGSYASGKMHHAWLIGGPLGIGKATFSFHLARHILTHPNAKNAPLNCNPNEWTPTTLGAVEQGAHPNILHLTRSWDPKNKRFKTQLTVDEIRRIQNFYGLTAIAGGWRITIVDCADDMNSNAANALLKLLEEPPRKSLIFVLSHRPGSLLPTIRSRCQAIKLLPLPSETLTAALKHLGLNDGKAAKAAILAGGSVRKAIQLTNGDVLPLYARFEKLMAAGPVGSAADWAVAHKVADILGQRGKEESFSLFHDSVMIWIGLQVRELAPTGDTGKLAGYAKVWEKATQSALKADTFNLDRKQVILTLFRYLFDNNAA